MAAVDVTRAEFEALLARVTRVEGMAVDVGDQFEMFKETFTELANNVTTQSSEYGDKFKKLEAIGIEASVAELVEKMKTFENLNFESTVKDVTEEINQVKQRMATEGRARAAPARSDWCEGGAD